MRAWAFAGLLVFAAAALTVVAHDALRNQRLNRYLDCRYHTPLYYATQPALHARRTDAV